MDRTAAGVLVAQALLAALFSNISDCDEVYNYWEPVRGLDGVAVCVAFA
jgi:hypothetical protein